MKVINYFLLLILALFTSTVANAAGSMLRVTCEGDDVGAEVLINGKFRGECPVDISIPEGKYKLHVEKKENLYERVYEQDIRMGDGVVKKVEAVLSRRLNAEGQQRENERLADEARKRAEFVAELAPKMVHIPGKNYEIGKFEVTHAEWEYACYGGSQTKYCGGNDVNAVAWTKENSSGLSAHPVGQKQPNGYGLFDMSGNVWEWTNDCHDGDCTHRILRGGSWGDKSEDALTSSYYGGWAPGGGDREGFRLARTLP